MLHSHKADQAPAATSVEVVFHECVYGAAAARPLCARRAGAPLVLPYGASVEDTLGYVPHAAHPALDAAMRELHASMHTNRPRSSMVRDAHTHLWRGVQARLARTYYQAIQTEIDGRDMYGLYSRWHAAERQTVTLHAGVQRH